MSQEIRSDLRDETEMRRL